MTPQLVEYQMAAGVRAFTTTRMGGTGEGAYAQFNITHYCGDNPEHVRENRKLLCEALGINDRQLLLPQQVHGTAGIDIDDDFLKLDDGRRAEALEGKDAIFTDIPGLCIGVSTADCVPVLLYDETRKAAAAVHAGWKGTAAGIVTAALRHLQEAYGCRPEHLQAVIGPSISLEAFEVGQEVYDTFRQAGFPMDSISRFFPTPDGDTAVDGKTGKWHIDLWAANWLQLEEGGVPMQHIQIANICTATASDSFFSARRMGIRSGRLFSGLLLQA